MRVAGEDEVGMDFVGTDDDVVAQTDLRHLLELAALEHTPDGVVRIAQDEQPCAFVDGGLEGIHIDRVPAVAVPGTSSFSCRTSPCAAGAARMGRVDGRLHQHAVATAATARHARLKPVMTPGSSSSASGATCQP